MGDGDEHPRRQWQRFVEARVEIGKGRNDPEDDEADETEHQAKDGFAFPYTRFLSEKSGASLIIKSNDRDYRFKADMPGKAGGHIEEIDAAIARLR